MFPFRAISCTGRLLALPASLRTQPKLSRRHMRTAAYAKNSLAHEAPREDAVEQALRILKTSNISWNHPGLAAFDFRSDVVTTPTLPMLGAIMRCSLRDDIYQEDVSTTSFESHIATLTGFSGAAFVLSGTMANQLALRTHLTQPPHAILADARSHILHWEAGGIASLCGAMVQGVQASNGEYLTLADIQRKVVLSDDVHKCPTSVISLENTIGGIIQPLEETRKISIWARENGLKMHLDGARLFEVVAAGEGSLREYASCFDSVGLDFSKGLGAPMGAIVVGDASFIGRMRRIRKSWGGGMRQAGVLSSAAKEALEQNFGLGVWGYEDGGVLRRSHSLAKKVSIMWTKRGGKLSKRTDTNLVWLDLRTAGIEERLFNQLGADYGLLLDGQRLVFHYQISDTAIEKLELLFDRLQDLNATLS